MKTALIAAGAGLLGVILSSTILLFNNWLQRKWEMRKWKYEKQEEAYEECLKLLNKSRRKPSLLDGQEGQWLERKESYSGLMDAMPHVPTWMIKMECTSSIDSKGKIGKIRNRIAEIVAALKSHEHEKPEERNKVEYFKDRGISQAIEDAIPIVILCYEQELLERDRFEVWLARTRCLRLKTLIKAYHIFMKILRDEEYKQASERSNANGAPPDGN